MADFSKPDQKPVFASVAEAKTALKQDKLGTVYRTATGVFVVTRWGSGKFSIAAWEKG